MVSRRSYRPSVLIDHREGSPGLVRIGTGAAVLVFLMPSSLPQSSIGWVLSLGSGTGGRHRASGGLWLPRDASASRASGASGALKSVESAGASMLDPQADSVLLSAAWGVGAEPALVVPVRAWKIRARLAVDFLIRDRNPSVFELGGSTSSSLWPKSTRSDEKLALPP